MPEKEGIGDLRRGAFRRLRPSIADGARTSADGGAHVELRAPLRDLRPADRERGNALLSGRFGFGSELLDVEPGGSPWSADTVSVAHFAWLHGFSWLRDALIADTDEPERFVREAVDGWIERSGKFRPDAWEPSVTAARLKTWLGCADVLVGANAPGAEKRLDAMTKQARRLEQSIPAAQSPRAKLACAATLAAAGACLPGGDRFLDAGLSLCATEADAQVLPDGGHASRSPEAVADILVDLYALDHVLHARGLDAPPDVRRAIDRMTPMLRFFRLSDGGLAAFHGGGESDASLIAAALACDDVGGKTFGYAPHSGYQRIEAGGAALVLDAGAPVRGAHGLEAHASSLAFEYAPAGGRLIVNCGWSPDQPPRFREPVRATAAHSTLVIEDTNSMRVGERAAKRDLLGARSGRGAPAVTARRNEEDLGVWVEGSHEGYRSAFGLVHRRRVFMFMASDAAKGYEAGEVRGEDTLFRPVDDPPPDEERPARYAIRFHLHPSVRATLSRDARSALLVLPDGEAWRFTTDAAPMAKESSVYLAAGSAPADSSQLVITGAAQAGRALDAPPNRVRWAFKRLGRAPAA